MTLNSSRNDSDQPRWKRWLGRVLLIVACLCLALSVLTIWARLQIGDSDRYVRTVTPLAADPAIQEAVVVAVTNRFSALLDDAATIDILSDRQRYLAAPLNTLLTDFVEETTRSYVTSEDFEQFWVEANRAIHPEVSAILTGSDTDNMTTPDGKITINLAPIVESIQTRLAERGIDLFSRVASDNLGLSIVVVDSPELAKVQGIIEVLYSLTALFPILMIVSLAGYFWLSSNRPMGIVWVGLGVASTMAILLLLLAVLRWQYLDRLDSEVRHDAAKAFFDTVARYLRASARLIAVFGLVTAGVALIFRPNQTRTRRGPSWFNQDWIARHRASLSGLLIAISCIAIITPDRITQNWGVTIVLAAVVCLVVIWLTSLSAPPDHPEPTTADGPITPMVERTQSPQTSINSAASKEDGIHTYSAVTRESLNDVTNGLSATDLELLGRVAGVLRKTE